MQNEPQENSIRSRLDRWLLVVCPTLVILTCLVASISGRVNEVRTTAASTSVVTSNTTNLGFPALNLSLRQN